MCAKGIKIVKIVINGKIIEQITEYKYLGNRISEFHRDIEYKLQTYNIMNGIIEISGQKDN
jgi:hypothetical protein